MFEDKTYENILQEMLNRVPDDIDKREGSVIYDALAPTAYSIADLYFQLKILLTWFFRTQHLMDF